MGGILLQGLARSSPGAGSWRPAGAAVCSPYTSAGCARLPKHWALPGLTQGMKQGCCWGHLPQGEQCSPREAQSHWVCEKLGEPWHARQPALGVSLWTVCEWAAELKLLGILRQSTLVQTGQAAAGVEVCHPPSGG